MTEVNKAVQKIHKVMSEVGAIPKNGYNKHFKYEFVEYDDIVAKISELMVAHGLVSYHTGVSIGIDEVVLAYDKDTGAPSRVKTFRTYQAQVVYEDVDSGHSLTTGPFYGEAELQDDKSIRKAERQASKIADLTTFKIVTGEPDFGEMVTEPTEDKVSRDVVKAKARKVPAEPKKTGIRAANVDELNSLRTQLAEKFGSKDAALEAGNKKYPKDPDWANSVSKLGDLLNG